jgi:hypothetical protein
VTAWIIEDGEWGEFVPGLRVEIEQPRMDPQSLSGWGPGVDTGSPCRWLTQRAYDSPHPLTWHSQLYADAEEAREARHRLLGTVPCLDHLQFLVHHDPLGPCSRTIPQTSVRHCPGADRHEVRALELLREILDDAEMIKRLLPP